MIQFSSSYNGAVLVPNKNIRTHKRLTDDLVLPDFFSNKLGYKSSSSLFEDLKDADEGYNSKGISHFCERISSRGTDISSYDLRIKKYVQKISHGREYGFRLKYYQYLAVLFTEMYFELFFSDYSKEKYQFISEINSFIDSTSKDGSRKLSSKDFRPPKLAYYMATGSGKTIVMHINYLQYLEYAIRNSIRIDNCVLITPSNQMTEQHINELNKSGIEALEFNGLTLESYSSNNYMIKVIDINKLKTNETKKGSGVTIDISGFGTHNLILVDEGHKGYKSEERTWANIRDQMSLEGFALEYSATFEQAVSSDQELYDTYAHSILIDYSYRHFYRDGYGKDFFIINLDKSSLDEIKTRNTLLLANSLSYLGQLLVYRDRKDIIKKYAIERPLWIFVGSKVSVSDKKTTSDIIDVVKFLDWVTSPPNRSNVMERIKAIIHGNSGIQDKKGNDVFARSYDEILFPYKIRPSDSEESKDLNYDQIYSDLLHIVFKSSENSEIELYKINETDGEIGIKCGSDFFGVIDVGDRLKLLNDIKEALPQIKIHDDKITKSLFSSITDEPEKIDILIGAKKFIEGWDTKRVSSMCLLSVGKKEGAQIIQLFGRGVRLNGENKSMKRELNPSNELRIVQMLYIFGIKASYLAAFRDIVKNEVLYTLRTLEITNNIKNIKPPLQMITLKENVIRQYQNESIILTYETDIIPSVNFLATAERVSLTDSGIQSVTEYKKCILDRFTLDMINWNNIYFKVLDYKFSSNFRNLIVSSEIFDSLVKSLFYNNSSNYELLMDPELFTNVDLKNVEIIEEAIFEIIKRYMVRFKDKKFREKITAEGNIFESGNFNGPIPENYKLYIDDTIAKKNSIPDIISIKKLETYLSFPIKKVETKYRGTEASLYVPLISYDENGKCYTIPVGLNEGEEKFVRDLILFINNNQNIDSRNLDTLEFYLYRNPARSGFHFYILNETIYPDFVLWVREKGDKKKNQVIIYIEPHGLVHSDPDNDPKLNLPGYLNKMKNDIKGLKTYAFIISVTDWDKLNWKPKPKCQMEKMGIIFQSDPDYIKKIFELVLK